MTRPGRAPLDEVTDHGGSLSRAARLFPDAPLPWLDLSTGINPHSYPVEGIPASAFRRLPEESRLRQLLAAAASTYRAPSPENVAAAPGTQILLPLVAALVPPGRAAILSPTYAEHRRAAAIAGHAVAETGDFEALDDADLSVLVNPNNPDGRVMRREALLGLAAKMRARGGLLVVDEAFMDVGPEEQSLAPDAETGGFVVLRSFGKFYGLAGLRLGFAVGPVALLSRIAAQLGPWAVSGPALEAGIAALEDAKWRAAMQDRLGDEAARLDEILARHALDVSGGTSLYRFVRTPHAGEIVEALGRRGILVRAFAHDAKALRFGLPDSPDAFDRLDSALRIACDRSSAKP